MKDWNPLVGSKFSCCVYWRIWIWSRWTWAYLIVLGATWNCRDGVRSLCARVSCVHHHIGLVRVLILVGTPTVFFCLRFFRWVIQLPRTSLSRCRLHLQSLFDRFTVQLFDWYIDLTTQLPMHADTFTEFVYFGPVGNPFESWLFRHRSCSTQPLS